MTTYSSSVKAEITHWQSRGLINAETAALLAQDIEARHGRGVRFAEIIGVLAAILVAAAILLFVAANWEAIPRLVRVALLFSIIGCGYVGGAVLKGRGARLWGEALFLVAATAFGAAIALIGQMYHIAGDEVEALAVWAAGTGFAAALLRSPLLTVGSVALAAGWMVATSNGVWSQQAPSIGFLPVALVLWGLSFWTGSPYARALILLAFLLYGALLALSWDAMLVAPLVMTGLSVGVFAFAVFRSRLAERVAGLGAALPLLALFGFLFSMALLQVSLQSFVANMFFAVLVFAGTVAALLTAGRESRRLRRLAYAGFAAEVVFLYVEFLGTILGTASFFLLSGAAFAGLAALIRHFERRFSSQTGSLTARDTGAGAS